jgi:hypothetical protein
LAAATPDLHLEVQQGLGTNAIKLHITNNGGAAKRVRFLVVEGHQMAYGTPQPSSTFRPGESRLIETNLQASGQKTPKGFIEAYNMAGSRFFVSPFTGDERIYRMKGWRRTRKDFSDSSIMRELYPEFDYDAMIVTRYETVEQHF